MVHADKVTYILTDPNGTVLAEADAQGNITKTFDYRPYGQQALGQPPNGPGYTGHVNDPDTDLVYMQARYYDPEAGRFLSADPVGPTPGDVYGFNRYVYANNNPIGNIDPNGRETGPAYAAIYRLDGGVPQTYISPNDRVGPAIQAGLGVLPVVGDGVNIGQAITNPSAMNIAAAAVGVLPVVGGVAADAVKGASAAERATAIAGTMSARTQRSVTIAVTETKEGVRVVSSSEGTLRSAAQGALKDGEVAGKGVAGTHAEVNGINVAKEMGLTPTGTAASRPICSSCAQALEQHGVTPLSPLKQQP
ncbi:RHS repeat-associated core domain-containing protein [Dyella psychrodurans]|uniref:RHS repeat-associated core domain-containing protein n=1 Tax=Dyella psychrodurans TaxID=1927960 RepID=A0A370X0V8_9GAMM|nr:RHS repeat-associated core domain-containing protein [Dyella psychrodurans]